MYVFVHGGDGGEDGGYGGSATYRVSNVSICWNNPFFPSMALDVTDTDNSESLSSIGIHKNKLNGQMYFVSYSMHDNPLDVLHT